MPQAVLGSQISSLRVQDLRITDEREKLSWVGSGGSLTKYLFHANYFQQSIYDNPSKDIPHTWGPSKSIILPRYITHQSKGKYPSKGKGRGLCGLCIRMVICKGEGVGVMGITL